jgi:predicted type IV restriction endonuclease
MEDFLLLIQTRLQNANHYYPNEQIVRTGIIEPLLKELKWDITNRDMVYAEFTTDPNRVDYALFYLSKPLVFIEAKQIGRIDERAEQQLLSYAFYIGVPLAILTDGREWNFYLPLEEGPFRERKVYKLDISERKIDDIIERFHRYLSYERVTSREAIEAAKRGYDSVLEKKRAADFLPKAWSKLVEEKDTLLVDLLAEKVSEQYGYKPDRDTVISFLIQLRHQSALTSSSILSFPERPSTVNRPAQSKPSTLKLPDSIGYSLYGTFKTGRNNRDIVIQIMRDLASVDSTFLERFEKHPKNHKQSRRYLARTPEELFNNPEERIPSNYASLQTGWYIMLKLGYKGMDSIIRLACEIANVSYDRDLVVRLSEPRKK